MQIKTRSISRNELKKRIDKGDIIVIDALSREDYEDFHIPEAINVPWGDTFEVKIQRVIPDKTRSVAVYCMSTECVASTRASEKMIELGYETVFVYEEGKTDWNEAGLPVERKTR